MFKERFKKLREEKGLTQSQLANELNIGRASISNYELGTRTPDIDVLIEISKYFNVTTDYLTGISPFKTIDERIDFEKNSNIFNDILTNINEINKKDAFNFIKKILNCMNDLFSYDAKLYIDFFTVNGYIVDIFSSMKNFVESQNEKNLYDYSANINNNSAPHPECKEIRELLTDIDERLEITYFYSRMLALKKACPELYNLIYNPKENQDNNKK